MRIVQYSLDDLVVDRDAVAASINQACQRAGGQRLVGLCQTAGQVLVVLEPCGDAPPSQCVIAPFSGLSAADVVGDLHSRRQGGFRTRGLIALPNAYLGLFEHEPAAAS